MTIDPDKLDRFKVVFRNAEDKIRSFPGCNQMEAFQDSNEPTIVFTYSIWDSAQSLENYRNSDLFKSVWAETKSCFGKPAEAWSLETLI